jgi:hypothetical protein
VTVWPPGATPVEVGGSWSGLGAARHLEPLAARGLALASASGGSWDWEPGNGSLAMAVG